METDLLDSSDFLCLHFVFSHVIVIGTNLGSKISKIERVERVEQQIQDVVSKFAAGNHPEDWQAPDE